MDILVFVVAAAFLLALGFVVYSAVRRGSARAGQDHGAGYTTYYSDSGKVSDCANSDAGGCDGGGGGD